MLKVDFTQYDKEYMANLIKYLQTKLTKEKEELKRVRDSLKRARGKIRRMSQIKTSKSMHE
jgi:tRNA(Phe) wybutosine-synthesizing methylase Tyw3